MQDIVGPRTSRYRKTNTEHAHLAGQLVDDVVGKRPGTPRQPKPNPVLPRTTKSNVLKRHMVARAQEHRLKVKKSRNKHVIAFVFAVFVVGSLSTVVWSFRDVLPFSISWASRAVEKDKSPKAPAPVIAPIESTTLDETEVTESEIATNPVQPTEPKILSIPALGTRARIKSVGSTLNGEPIAPSNIYDVGWFRQGGHPGVPGAVLLNGHAAGPSHRGVFDKLDELSDGDLIDLELGNGGVLTYSVVSVQEFTAKQINMSNATNAIDPNKQGLNLITTYSKYNQEDKRVIVYAVLN